MLHYQYACFSDIQLTNCVTLFIVHIDFVAIKGRHETDILQHEFMKFALNSDFYI